MKYLEIKDFLGRRNFIAVSDVYGALVWKNGEIRECGERNIIYMGRREGAQCGEESVPILLARIEMAQKAMSSEMAVN